MRIYTGPLAAPSPRAYFGRGDNPGSPDIDRYNPGPFGMPRPSVPSQSPMSFAFVFPGQGSQSVGMMRALAAAEPIVEQTFAEASEVLGYDLWKLCQEGPEEQLGATERTQPAMLTAGVATWRVWRKHGGGLP